MSKLSDLRFLFVTGKGGVGKSTVCAAEALAIARQGKRVLVAMCHAKERLSNMLGCPPIGDSIAPVAPGVWAVNLNPDRAIEEYGIMVLRSRTVYKALFDNKYVRTFLRGVPGMQEWSMLGKAWFHTTETLPDGSPRFDVVILDAPATGHGLDMLRVPKVLLDVVPPGILRRDAERAMDLFRDPKQTAVVLVTLPEEMPTSETIELAESLTTELRIPIGRIVVNGVLPPLFSQAERAALSALPEVTPESPEEAVILSSQRRAQRERVQAESLRRLTTELPVKPLFLPLLLRDAAHPDAILELSRRLS